MIQTNKQLIMSAVLTFILYLCFHLQNIDSSINKFFCFIFFICLFVVVSPFSFGGGGGELASLEGS